MTDVIRPYTPYDGYSFTGIDDRHMALAEAVARHFSLDLKQKVGCVLVSEDGATLSWGANGSDYHTTHGCERKRRGCKTGEGYDLCPGCSVHNHAEMKAVRMLSESLCGSVEAPCYAFLWGHWYTCGMCSLALLEAGVEKTVLLEGSERLFNAEHADFIFRTPTPHADACRCETCKVHG